MKYLQDYMSAAQTAALNKAGAFFAFSTKQFEEQKVPGTKYVSTPSGLICPKHTLDTLVTEMDEIYRSAIAQDIEENGLHAIIVRELNNHEAYYTGDIATTVDALEDYPVTEDDIIAVFRDKAYDPDSHDRTPALV